MMSRRASAVVIVALVVIALLAGALPVFASPSGALPLHARLVSSIPADGASVDTADSVVLGFSEEVDPTFVEVTVKGPGGDEAAGRPEVDGREVTQGLATGLAPGEHVVTYRVVSADGHPISGTVTFASTVPPTPSATPTATAGTAPSATQPADDAEAASGGGPGTGVWVLLGVVALAALLALATRQRLLAGRHTDDPMDPRPDDGSVATRPDGRDDPFA